MRVSLNLLRTSTFRLVAVYLTVFVVSVGAILGYIYWNTVVLLEGQTDETIRAEVQGLAEQYRVRGLPGLLDIVNNRSQDPQGAVYIFTNSIGRRLAGNLPSIPATVLGKEGMIEFQYPVETSRGLAERTARAFYVELDGGFRLVVGRDVEERRQFDRIIRTSILWALGLALVLGVGGGLLTSRNFLRRIDQITRASQTIMAGDLGERMPVSGTGDELDRLSHNLNNMLDRIGRLMAGMKEVSSNVAHDLRTPLTRLRARAEDALRTGDEARHKTALEATIAEADGLLKTFTALLSIARAEAGQSNEGLKTADAAEIAADVADLYAPIAEEEGGSLSADIAGPAMIRADRQLVAQAISNLLDNAMKYGRSAGSGKTEIVVSVRRREHDVEIAVTDAGVGIPEAEREHVKERFVRLDESRAETGNGLGLSLVASVMKLHGGRFELTARSDGISGLRAALVFPAEA